MLEELKSADLSQKMLFLGLNYSNVVPFVDSILTAADKEEAEEFLQPRRFFHRICTHGYFDLGISAVIVLNVICMAMEHYDQPQVSQEHYRIQINEKPHEQFIY